MDETLYHKMERDISELTKGQVRLKTDMAVTCNKIDNISDMLEKYMERKDAMDRCQNTKLHELEEGKANKDDIDKLLASIKWLIGTLVGTIVSVLALFIKP